MREGETMSYTPPNLLLIEDDIAAAKLIMINLKRAGITSIIHAKNGAEGLKELKKLLTKKKSLDNNKIIVLLDIKMPVMDGIETLTIIKSKESLKKTPVIMLTTTDDPREIRKCYELGCNFYLRKPVDYKDFVNALNKLADFVTVCTLCESGEESE